MPLEFKRDPSALIFPIPKDFLTLMVSLGLLIFLPAFVPSLWYKNITSYILLTLASILGVMSVSTTKKRLYWGLALAGICFLFNTLSLAPDAGLLLLMRTFGFILLFTYVVYGVLTRVTSAGYISINIIYGSIAGYLLMGILGGFWCFFINFMYPGAFSMAETEAPTINTLTYFSFVSMTTVGYGDIIPSNGPAKAVSLFIAIVGQMYMTITIAILVSKYVQHQSGEEEENEN